MRIQPLNGRNGCRASAQLTQRTNQFNFTTIRRTEQEIQSLVASGALECWTVDVSDRFGDYGLTGVVLFSVERRPLDHRHLPAELPGFGTRRGTSQSCRAVAEEARQSGLDHVVADLVPTSKNQPARDFLEELRPVARRCP